MGRDTVASMIDMLVAARRAVKRLANASELEFAANEDLQWVLYSQIIIIGEAANRVPKDDQLR